MCIYFIDPEHLHGLIKGSKSEIWGHKQILQIGSSSSRSFEFELKSVFEFEFELEL